MKPFFHWPLHLEKNMHYHINWFINSQQIYGSKKGARGQIWAPSNPFYPWKITKPKFPRQKWLKSIKTVIGDAYWTDRNVFTDATFCKRTNCRGRGCDRAASLIYKCILNVNNSKTLQTKLFTKLSTSNNTKNRKT